MLTDDDLLQVMNEAFDRYDEETVQTLDGRKLAIGRAVERAAYAAAIKACKSTCGQKHADAAAFKSGTKAYVQACDDCEDAIRSLMAGQK